MPIRPDLRHLYAGPLWAHAKRTVALRAGGCCEWCRKPDRTEVVKAERGRWARSVAGPWFDERGRQVPTPRGAEVQGVVFVILTTAHLDQNPEDGHDPERMAHLCQRCHLMHDREQHALARAQTRRDKSGNLELFE